MKRFLATAAAVLMLTSSANAEMPNGDYQFYGPGASEFDHSCFAWVHTAPLSPIDISNRVWLAGFLSAWNASNHGIYDAIQGADTAAPFIRMTYEQCQAYENLNISQAAYTIAHRLTERQLAPNHHKSF
jgi:hypothetical protein